MKYLILDSNVFLHYIDIEQIEWKTLITNGEDFTIVIPAIVMREIDKIKDSGNGKVQKRAKKISSKIGDIFLEDKNLNFPIIKCNDPLSNQFDDMKFNKLVNDDWIILSSLNFPVLENDKIVVAADNNLLMKARENGLNIFRMGDRNKLKEEITPEEKEFQKIKSELNTLKNRQPKPKITFDDGSTLLKIKKPIIRDFEEEFKMWLDKFKSENRHTSTILSDNFKMVINENYKIPWTVEQSHQYNILLDEYITEYEEYTRFILQDDITGSYFKKISLKISNDGNAATGNMNIFINFPENVKLYDLKSKTKRIMEQPFKPQKNLSGMSRDIQRSLIRPVFSTPIQNYRYFWDISNTIKNELTIQFANLNLKLSCDLEIENSLIINTSECGNFNIKWRIHDSELPEPVEGTLSIVIDSDFQ
jgi:rRNA-processing protein FCF1